MPASARSADPKPAAKPAVRAATAKPPAADETLQYRLGVLSRSLAAAFGGYLLANLFVPAFSRTIPMAPRDASQLALMLSFIVFALASVWAFATRDALRAWIGILLPAALFAAILWLVPEVRA